MTWGPEHACGARSTGERYRPCCAVWVAPSPLWAAPSPPFPRPHPGKHLTFDVELMELTPAARLQTVVFGAGCFWGPQLLFDRVVGALLALGMGGCPAGRGASACKAWGRQARATACSWHTRPATPCCPPPRRRCHRGGLQPGQRG